MNRIDLVKSTIDILEKAGFYVASISGLARVSFDIVARRDDLLLVVRIVVNIDSISRETTNELKTIGNHLSASVVIVGKKSTSGVLEPGVVYSRYAIPIINLETLEDLFLHGIEPFSHSAHGGIYVSFNGELLQRTRIKSKIPLSTLAEIAGVSKRTIQLYENGMDVSVDTAFRLEEFLGMPLILSTSILGQLFEDLGGQSISLKKCDSFVKEVLRSLQRMGTPVVPIYRCPFNAFTGKDKSIIITGISLGSGEEKKRIEIVSKISTISEKRAMFIVDELKARKNLDSTALVEKKEIDRLRCAEDMDKLIDDRIH